MTELISQTLSVITSVVFAISSLAGVSPQTQLAQVVAPTSGLVEYLNFDSESAVGKIGQAKSFNGTSDYFQTSSSDLKTADNFTVSVWIKADSTDMRHIVWQGNSSGNGGGAEEEFAINLGNTTSGASGVLQLFIEGTNNDINITTPFTDTSNWNHVMAVVSGLNTSAPSATLYLNGVSVGSDTADSITRSTWDTSLRIGRPGVNSRLFDGLIDEVRVYNRALSSSEILDIYNDAGSTTPPPPPLSGDTTSPSVPSNLSASAVSSSQINLSWSASSDPSVSGQVTSGVSGYRIYRNGSQVTTTSSTSYSDSNLTPSTTYSYTVSAYDGAGNISSQSSSVSATTQAGTTPPPPPPTGNTFYIRDGGTSSTCTDWTNACDTLPATLQRGATYYIADGTYTTYEFNTPNSGTQTVTIKKATASDHGTNTGWVSTYGDGQASFGGIRMLYDYLIFDGQTRNESNWQDSSAYGFRINGSVITNMAWYPRISNNNVFRYVDVGGPNGDTFNTSIPSSGFYFGGFGQTASNWTISRSHIHNVYLPFQIAGGDNITIEYSWLGPNWSKETVRGQNRASNITIRHNVFKDGCQGTPGDPTAGGCTGQIAMWDGSAGNFDGSKIYGNLIWTTKGTHHSDAAILVGGNGVSTAGASANNVLVYNNTIVGIQSGQATIRFDGSHTGDVAQNNIWYGLGNTVTTGCSANTCTNNIIIPSASQFLNAAGGNFRLASATQNGTSISSPYNTDMDGKTRGADGVWDLGAYEFSGSSTPPPPTITYTITSSSGTGGTITPSGTVTVNSGSSQTFTITPNTGYQISGVTVNGTNQGAISTYTFSNVTSNGTISATFSQIQTPTSNTFSPNDRVQVNVGVGSNLNVRATASASGTLLGTQPNLALGTVISGGTQADGYFWWNVNFDSGVDGFVVEDFLSDYVAPPPPPTPIVGDLNNDGLVNSIDLSLLTSKWLQVYAPYDLNNDGIVSSLDYAVMVQNWSQ